MLIETECKIDLMCQIHLQGQEWILARRGPAARAPFRGRSCGQLLGAGSSISVLARELKHAITPCLRAKSAGVQCWRPCACQANAGTAQIPLKPGQTPTPQV